MPTLQIDLYCDGACSGNPGPGGYASTLIAWNPDTDEALKTLHNSGLNLATTHNQMELTAALEGLKALTKPATLQVVSDSQYLIKGMTEWTATWQSNGWRNSKKQAVENQDLWKALLEVAQPHTITWNWTKGHSTSTNRYSYFNRLVDEEAVKQRDRAVLLAPGTPVSVEQAHDQLYALTGRLVRLNGDVIEKTMRRAERGYSIYTTTVQINVTDDYTLYLLPKPEGHHEQE